MIGLLGDVQIHTGSMAGSEPGIQRMADTEVHVQRAGLGSIDRTGSWSPGQRAGQSTQSDQQETAAVAVDDIKADPEVLADEVEQIKANQQLVMETLTEAKPGSATEPGADGWAKTALKGVAGSLTSAWAGAAIGSLVGGPAGTVIGAGVGAVGGMSSDLVKQGIEYAGDRLPGSQAQDLEQMYSEMTRMYNELKEGSEHADTVVGASRSD